MNSLKAHDSFSYNYKADYASRQSAILVSQASRPVFSQPCGLGAETGAPLPAPD
jgi:hypothetical protein